MKEGETRMKLDGKRRANEDVWQRGVNMGEE